MHCHSCHTSIDSSGGDFSRPRRKRTMGPFPSEFKNELHEVDTKIVRTGGGVNRHHHNNRLGVDQAAKMTRSASIVSLVPAGNSEPGDKHSKYIYKTEGRVKCYFYFIAATLGEGRSPWLEPRIYTP